MMSRTVISETEQHALDHRQRVGVEQLALEGAVQQVEQLLAVLGLARQERGEPLEQRRLRRRASSASSMRSGRRAVRVGDSPGRARIARSRASIALRVGVACRGRSPAGAACRGRRGARSGRRSGLPCARASRRSTGAQSTMSPASGSRVIVHERQHVGRVVLAAVARVERAALARADEAQRHARRRARAPRAPSGAASARTGSPAGALRVLRRRASARSGATARLAARCPRRGHGRRARRRRRSSAPAGGARRRRW